MKRLLALGFGLCAAAARGDGTAPTETPVVVELFTSEGCSSCPPADALLSRLEAEQPIPGVQVIALSEHVDYWNRLGWTDPYSSKQFSQRQTGYADALRTASVYTPQMIVDGGAEFVGSDARKARKEIEKAATARKATVQVARGGGSGGVLIRVASLHSVGRGDTVEVLLAVVEDGIRSDVRRGENAGRKLAHAAVVRALDIIGSVGAEQTVFEKRVDLTLDPSWRRDRLRAVAFVQEKGSRRILGAGQLGL